MMIAAQWKYEFITWLRNGEQALLNFIIPALVLAAAHFVDASSQASIASLAILAANAASAFTGLAIVMAFDRRYGVLKFFAVSPLGLNGFYVSKVLVSFTISLIQSSGLLVLAYILKLPTPQISTVFLALLVFTPLWVSLAFIYSSTMSAENVLALANALFVILAASALPMSHLDAPAKLLNPLVAGLEVLNLDALSIGVAVVFAVTCAVFAKRTFRWLD